MVTRRRGPVRREVERTVKALQDAGRLEPMDSAEIALVRTLASDIDDLPPDSRTKPQQIRTLSLLLRNLRGTDHDAHDIDALVDRLASGVSSMGDSPI